jgi:hypothetical protein
MRTSVFIPLAQATSDDDNEKKVGVEEGLAGVVWGTPGTIRPR